MSVHRRRPRYVKSIMINESNLGQSICVATTVSEGVATHRKGGLLEAFRSQTLTTGRLPSNFGEPNSRIDSDIRLPTEEIYNAVVSYMRVSRSPIRARV